MPPEALAAEASEAPPDVAMQDDDAAALLAALTSVPGRSACGEAGPSVTKQSRSSDGRPKGCVQR